MAATAQEQSLAVPVVIASIGTGSMQRGGEVAKSVVAPTELDPLVLIQTLSLSTPVAASLTVPPTDFAPLVLAQASSLSIPVLSALIAMRDDSGASRSAPAPRLPAPVLVASADASADFRPLRPAPEPAPTPTPGPSAAPVLIATAAPRAGRGESALIGVAPAPTPGPSAAPVLIATAGPRAGRGESALIGVAPASTQAPENGDALVLAAAPVRTPGGESWTGQGVGAGAAADDWTAALKKASGTWVIPPVRWSGELAMDLQVSGAQGQPRSQQLVETASIKGSSYIWKPWFAQVGGDLTLITSQRGTSGGAQGAAVTTTGLNSTNLTGSGRLSLVPASRFPFSASFTASDSRTSGELSNNPLTSRSYSLAQSYSPAQGGGSVYALTYNRSDVISSAFGTDTANALGANMNWSSGLNVLRVTGNAYTNSAGNSGNKSANNNLVADHSYGIGTNLSVNSQANYNTNKYNVTNSGKATDLRFRTLQISSSATWQPVGTLMTVNGGVRFFQNGTSIDGELTDTRSFSANAAATYKLTPATTVNGGVGVSHYAASGSSSVSTNQTLGISHSPATIQLGEYGYNWGGGANMGNQTGANGSDQNIDANIGHRVNRSITLGSDANLILDASQSYSTLRSNRVAASQSLLHDAGAAWSKRLTESANTSLNLRVSDSRTTGYTDQVQQVGTLQGNGQVALDRSSFVSAAVTFRASRQAMSSGFPTGAESTPAGGFDTSINGTLTYQHSRAFGVPRLRYYALVGIADQNSRTRLQGNINAPVERTAWNLEQRLDYDVGRLAMRLSLTVAEVGGKVNGMLYFRVARSFGGL